MGSEGGEISMTDAIKVENVALQFPRGRGLFGGIKSLLGFKGLPEKNFTALDGYNHLPKACFFIMTPSRYAGFPMRLS